MIERHVTFEVMPGKESAFEELFKTKYSTAMAKQLGFVSVGLLREHDKPTNYQMLIRFQSFETAALWRDSADHQELQPQAKALYNAVSVVVYDVIA